MQKSTAVDFPGLDDDGNPIVVPHYPVAEAARRLHVSRPTLRAYCRSGRWPYQPIGNRIYMTDADMTEALRRERDRAIAEAQAYGVRGVVAPLLTEPGEHEGVQ